MRRPLNILLVNNKSKHYQEIVDYLRIKGTTIVRVDPLKANVKKINFDLIDGSILTGGNDIQVEKKRRFNHAVIRALRNKPILGICYGHEFLIEYYNGHLFKMNWRSQGYAYARITKNNPLIGKGRICVYKGHSFACGLLPENFEKIGDSNDCENEMVQHISKPHFGVQFHPEMTKDGRVIFDNFLKMCNQHKI